MLLLMLAICAAEKVDTAGGLPLGVRSRTEFALREGVPLPNDEVVDNGRFDAVKGTRGVGVEATESG